MSVIDMLPHGGNQSLSDVWKKTLNTTGGSSYTFTKDYKHVIVVFAAGSNVSDARTPTFTWSNVDELYTKYQDNNSGNGSAMLLIAEAWGVHAGSQWRLTATPYNNQGTYIFAIGE